MSRGKSKKVLGTKQTLEFVEEEKKFHVKQIKCMNSRQKEFLKSIESHEVTICSGTPGSGKTFLSLYAFLKMLEKNQIEQILLVKSVTQIPHEEIGFLKGSLEEKLSPSMQSYFHNIDKLIGEEQRKNLISKGKIKVVPLAFIRGCQFDNAGLIMDEVQNITMDIFKSLMTRIGYNSKYIFLGDIEQCDLHNKKDAALSKLIKIFENDENIGMVQFKDEDCVRNPIIPKILQKLREYEEKKEKEQK